MRLGEITPQRVDTYKVAKAKERQTIETARGIKPAVAGANAKLEPIGITPIGHITPHPASHLHEPSLRVR